MWNPLIERSGQSNLTSMKFAIFAENSELADFEFFNGIERIADTRRRMSRFGWKTDGIFEGAEGRFMTRSGSWHVRSGLGPSRLENMLPALKAAE